MSANFSNSSSIFKMFDSTCVPTEPSSTVSRQNYPGMLVIISPNKVLKLKFCPIYYLFIHDKCLFHSLCKCHIERSSLTVMSQVE